MKVSPHQIRPAKIGDLEDVVAADFEAFGPKCYPRFFFRQALDAFPDTFLVAEHDTNGVVGYGLAVVTSISTNAWILAMAVAEKHRRRGVGESLLTHLCQTLMHAGIAAVNLTVDPRNISAVRLYQKHDFVEVAREEDYFGPDEPRIVMRRSLVEKRA